MSNRSVNMIAALASLAFIGIGGMWLLGITGDAFSNIIEARDALNSCIFCGDEEEAFNRAKTKLIEVCGMWLGFLFIATLLPWGEIFD